MKFTERRIKMPKHDADVVLVFPGGQELLIQARPSNADGDYPGSLDIVLPDDQAVTNWKGDDMANAPQVRGGRAHEPRQKSTITCSTISLSRT